MIKKMSKFIIKILIIVLVVVLIKQYIDIEIYKFDTLLAEAEIRLYNSISINTEMINKLIE